MWWSRRCICVGEKKRGAKLIPERRIRKPKTHTAIMSRARMAAPNSSPASNKKNSIHHELLLRSPWWHAMLGGIRRITGVTRHVLTMNFMLYSKEIM